MEWLSRSDLRRLSALCKAAYYEDRSIMASDGVSDLKKSFSAFDAERMALLMDKLDRIADSAAKRIEITF